MYNYRNGVARCKLDSVYELRIFCEFTLCQIEETKKVVDLMVFAIW